MKNFNKYISDIKSLKVKSMGWFSDLKHYNSIQSGYPAELEILQKNAFNDLRSFPPEQIKQTLSLLYQLETLFSETDKNYPALFMKSQNGNLTREEVFEYLKPLFNYIRLDDDNTSTHAIIGIYSAILTKHNSILRLKNRTEDLLADKSMGEKNSRMSLSS